MSKARALPGDVGTGSPFGNAPTQQAGAAARAREKQSRSGLPVKRCAIYTRKSSEEGLEQDFNSLQAQREACEAFIHSQRSEGWRLVATGYDDGGLSGGTLERPALQRLLADIALGRVDVVVVYKVDRLTRSLADFARMVELFDAQDVSFVAVTQQFNTTSSMGRLTLNVLLSFAQFEREVTGERIRDKIAASKRKGLWMGGHVPLGYEPDGRTLVINDPEAETVRTLFRLYLQHGTVRRVQQEAGRLGLATKQRPGPDGQRRGGRPFSRGHLYKLLGNPLYAGRIAHKGVVHAGQHPPIVDGETWEAVQRQLQDNAPTRGRPPRQGEPSLLAGKLVDEAGERLTPSHAVKQGRRYRYYVSSRLVTGTARDTQGWRLPAGEIERTVAEAVRRLLSQPSALASAAEEAGIDADPLPGLLAAANRFTGDPLALVQQAALSADGLALTLDLKALGGQARSGEALPPLHHRVPMRIKRRGVEMRLILDGPGAAAPKADPALLKAVARARHWFDALVTGRAASIADLAIREGVSPRFIGHRLALAFLAPDIVAAIAAGRQPATLTAEALIRRTDLPLDWADQRALLGFT